ncbi:MAG: polysaccharide deacetylase family protein [Planctomycetia bacterium]|nr:polysaccharide deacetylase family protein [Planctomycetia bacterium]
MQVATLLYHDVVPTGQLESSGFCGAVANRYKLSCDIFDAHLLAIAVCRNLTIVTARELLREPASRQCSGLFSFDDAGVSAMIEIAERLEAFGWRGNFFVPTNYIGQSGFLSAAQILELHERGHVIGSHSCSHPRRIDELNDCELQTEWTDSSIILSDIVGERVSCGSVPGGFYSARVAAAAEQAGLKILFNSEPVCRWFKHGSMWIAGRLPIVDHTPATKAAKLVVADPMTILREQVLWNGKKLTKSVAGRLYQRASEWLHRHKHRSRNDSTDDTLLSLVTGGRET